jgi:hypothetical protein
LAKSVDKMTPIYAAYPADNTDPYLIIKKPWRGEIDYTLLPWPLEALPGTIWCNINTGSRIHIIKIGSDRWGRLEPIIERNEDGGIGVWRNDDFCIHDWVRIDHLPSSSQLAWFCYQVDYLRRRIKQERTPEEMAHKERIEAELLRSGNFTFTHLEWPTPFYRNFRKMVEDLAIAISRARTFALEHDLPMPSNISIIRTFGKRQSMNPIEEDDIIQNVCLSLTDINLYSFEQLSDLLGKDDNSIRLAVPLNSIGRTGNPLDIAYDYLKALFVGETLAAYCEEISIKAEEYWDAKLHLHSVYFILRPRDVTELAKALIFLSQGFINPHEYLKSQAKGFPEGWLPDDFYEETPESVKFHEDVAEFEVELEQRAIRFPELADSYLANYIHGCEPEGIELDTTAHPEYKYMFWKSFLSTEVGFNFYVSSELWILPVEVDIENLLVKYGGFRQGVPDLYEATPLTMGNLPPIVFNKYYMTGYPVDEIARAQKCAEEVFSMRLHQDYEDRPLNIINQVLLDKERGLIVASDQIAQYIFFRDGVTGVSSDVVRIILDNLPVLSSLTGEQISISCPWYELDDAQFEELCYDVVQYHFHPAKIEKMGKSRSRDGGRDIVFELARLGKPHNKWIVQCKLIRDEGSLSSRKVQVSDTIDQYGADGYCVMTTGLIDATLYDKLEGIKRNRSIQYDTWSRLELERFLARHLHIVHQYFPSLVIKGEKA